MSAECPLQNFAVFGAVEQRAPLFKLSYPVAGFLGVELGHAPVVKEFSAAHGVAEMDAPVIFRSTLDIEAATPPSAITVCALPRSDLHTTPTLAP